MQPLAQGDWRVLPYVDRYNEFGFQQTGSPFLHRVVSAVSRYAALPGFSTFAWNVGTLLLLTLLLFALRMPHTGPGVLPLATSMIVYDLGTMLLLSSFADSRLFYFNFLVFPLISAALLAQAPRSA